MPRPYWEAMDSYGGKRGWSRSELVRRLLERAKVIELDPDDAAVIPPDPDDKVPSKPPKDSVPPRLPPKSTGTPGNYVRSLDADKIPGTPEWRKRKISSAEGRKEIAAWDAEHEEF